jgi:hypothetical protein
MPPPRPNLPKPSARKPSRPPPPNRPTPSVRKPSNLEILKERITAQKRKPITERKERESFKSLPSGCPPCSCPQPKNYTSVKYIIDAKLKSGEKLTSQEIYQAGLKSAKIGVKRKAALVKAGYSTFV